MSYAAGKTDPYRVLVVDDDPIAVKSLTQTLESAGFRVWSLGGAIGISQLVLRERIDCIVLDLVMPTMRGDRLVRMLRQNPRLARVPVVIVSAESDARLDEVARATSVAVTSKGRVARELVPTVRQLVLRFRTATDERPSAEQEAIEEPPAHDSDWNGPTDAARQSLLEEFMRGMPVRVSRLTHAWESACRGDTNALQTVRRELHRLKGECQLLRHEPLVRLVERMELAVNAMPRRGQVPSCLSLGVRAALNTVNRVGRAGGSTELIDMDAAIARIDEARTLALAEETRTPWETVTSRARRLLSSLIPPSSSAL